VGVGGDDHAVAVQVPVCCKFDFKATPLYILYVHYS